MYSNDSYNAVVPDEVKQWAPIDGNIWGQRKTDSNNLLILIIRQTKQTLGENGSLACVK